MCNAVRRHRASGEMPRIIACTGKEGIFFFGSRAQVIKISLLLSERTDTVAGRRTKVAQSVSL